MKKKTSLKDIAERVGVSTALVSYVLNNQKEGRIGKIVSEKIRKVALELNYRTNHVARSLKTNKTFTIGLIVADISNAFSASLTRIIEDAAERSNYTVLFGSSDENTARSTKLIDILLNHQVDGFIISPTEHSEGEIVYLQENEVPFVMIDRFYPDVAASYVGIDNHKAAFTAVAHLLENGWRRVGIITYDTPLYHLQERTRGYLSALNQHGIIVNQDWIKKVGVYTTGNEVHLALDQLLHLPEPVDAIVFASNTISTFGLKYLNTSQVRVPDNVAIVSFDESDASELFYAPLTHIRQPLKEMGELATKILLDSIEKNGGIQQFRLEGTLVVRKSSIRQDQ
ncbi:LacI family transcriptional regulator [Segetibacter sp. 3557_3]|uniref:LacI family DNA-binding transcriptional regulator n=1 Tax=Segetibacter sp. 3557_3 TaxID=2547429 RepID=UPI0010592116|nr:substrate-binding domain-containing protein [Segetibacter sp. 3557_3]TDH26615.1 LacI family transcriptional regulator [Segetibacter sp. 3557_3]